MTTFKFDGLKLKQAIAEFGSLQEAVLRLRVVKNTLEKGIKKLSVKRDALKRSIAEEANTLKQIQNAVEKETEKLKQIIESAERRGRQYILFESLVAMLLNSHSTRKSLEDLAYHIFSLAKESWITYNQLGGLRQLFLTIVIGKHMHCYRCTNCGASFIVSMKPNRYSIGHYCPVCVSFHSVIANDLFLEALLENGNSDENKQVK